MQTTKRQRKFSTRDRNKYNVFQLIGNDSGCKTMYPTNRTNAYNLCRKLAKEYVAQYGGTMVQHNTSYVIYRKGYTDPITEFYMLEVQ
jgi:hypothetical protein